MRLRNVVARVIPACLLISGVVVTSVGTVVRPVGAVSSSTMSADNLRTGWYPDQPGLTPSLVSGGTFGQLFSTPVVGQVYAQPLIVNGVVVVVTEADWIYGIDAATGAIRWSRNVGTPFNPAELACSDLSPTVGITGTPAIDEATDTAYFMAKAYVSGSSGPVMYQMHAVDIATGVERAGFPTTIQGNAQNNTAQPFTARTEIQRPGLLLMNGVVYAAFAGHCDVAPYRGFVAGVSTAGTQVALFSLRAGDATASGNGIWQSGGGLVSDRPGSMVFATGNGIGGGSPITPTPGTQPPADLGESVVRLNVQPDGTLAATDFFTPFDAAAMDAADADLGSGGPVALPSQWFGTPSVPHVIVEMGKGGYLYVLDGDHLGGAQQGPGGGDQVVNRLGPYGGVWSHPAVWPGDGGYLYVPANQGRVSAFKYGVDGAGKPTFSRPGLSADSFGFGSGAPVVTSNGTTSGSALVWFIWNPDGSGANAQLRAYDPVPNQAGQLVLRWSAPIGTAAKFMSPGVAGNRLYVGTRDGHLLAFGAPVNAPVTAPAVSLPTTTIGQTSTATATITATAPVTVTSLAITGSAFSAGTASRVLPASLSTGQSLTVPITFAPTVAGTAAGTLDVTTSGGFVQVPLSGTGQNAAGLLISSPILLSFGGTPIGGVLTGTVVYSNSGGTPISVQGITVPAAPFSASGLPPVGSVIPPGGSVSISVSFAPSASGQFTDDITVASTGGSETVPLSGSAAAPGVLTISPLSIDAGTIPVGGAATTHFTVSNTGGSALTITKSKPPALGQFHAVTSLNEGTTIAAGQSIDLQVSFTPVVTGTSTDVWVLNSDQPGSTVQTVTFTGVGTASTGVDVPDPSAGGWTLNGTATLLGSTPGSKLRLTPATTYLAGSAFWPSPLSTTVAVKATFDFDIGGGTGADGITFILADPAQGATASSLGGLGNGLGAATIPAVTATFVTYPFESIGISVAGSSGTYPNYVARTTAVPSLRAGTHHARVDAEGGTMTVSIDGSVVLTHAVTLPPTVLAGFTAANGEFTDVHSVSNVAIHTGSPALLSITPAPVDFGSVVIGNAPTAPITIANVGGTSLTLGAATLPSAPFAVTGLPASGTVLAPGQSTTASVSFAPLAIGSASGTLTLASSAGPASVALSGAAVPVPTTTTTTQPSGSTTTTTPSGTTTTSPSGATTTTSGSGSGGPAPSGGYVAIDGARVLDTRSGYATADGRSSGIGRRVAGSTTSLVVAGRVGVPPGAGTVVLNVAVTDPAAAGFVTVFPCGADLPTAANLNYVAGQTIGNSVVAKVGDGGAVCLYTLATTDLVVDVEGWFPQVTVPTRDFSSFTPTRLLDTRPGFSTGDGVMAGVGLRSTGQITEVSVAGRASIPGDAAAVSLDVAVTGSTAAGFVTVFPCGTARPNAASITYAAGQTIANAVVARLGAGGTICVYSHSPTHVVIDVNGWFPVASTAGFITPARLLDTRPGFDTADGIGAGGGRRDAGSVTQVVVTGRASVPSGAAAVVLDLSVTGPTTGGFLTAYPCGHDRPNASNLNFEPGQTISNGAIVAVGDGGAVCIFSSAPTHLVVDVSGWFPAVVGPG